MSAITPTEAHYEIVDNQLRTLGMDPREEFHAAHRRRAAQLIAESEARAIADALRIAGFEKQIEAEVATRADWAKLIAESNKLRAEVKRLTKDSDDYAQWIACKMFTPEWDSFKKSLEVIEYWKTRTEKVEAELDMAKHDIAVALGNNEEMDNALTAEREKVRVLREAIAKARDKTGRAPVEAYLDLGVALAATEQPKPEDIL